LLVSEDCVKDMLFQPEFSNEGGLGSFKDERLAKQQNESVNKLLCVIMMFTACLP
jgi:hypothetical protein